MGPTGKLFYIIGPSGAGKDSLIDHCRAEINGTLPIVFAHRYITRPANIGSENHIYLSPAEFGLRLQHGHFTLHWESHDLCYGIGTEINTWLNSGLNVVVNGSREYLATALSLYPDMLPILIDAHPDIIRSRLKTRGRENDEQIAARMLRNELFDLQHTHLVRIQNNRSVADAATDLITIFKNQVTTELQLSGCQSII